MPLKPSATVRGWRQSFDKRLHDSRFRPSRVRAFGRSLPVVWAKPQPTRQPNTFFSRKAIHEQRGHVQRLAFRDKYLRERMSDPRIAGVRDWEYGTLLGLLSAGAPKARALDVGSGRSTFPTYLLSRRLVGSMTTLDLESAYERRNDASMQLAEKAGVQHVEGSMLKLPFPDHSYDLVTCISAIEHLDGSPKLGSEKPPYEKYLADTRLGMTEMARVVAPGGLLYVTTDAYIPERQTTDSWSSPRGDRPIWSAYRLSDLEATFVAPVLDSGLELIGDPDFREELLVGDQDRATYRGRYFTTFAIAARRPA